MLKPKESHAVDADLGGSSGVPKDGTSPGQPTSANLVSIQVKADAAAQTDDDLKQEDSEMIDRENFETEIALLKEHHDLECVRLSGNIDFWKEKVDGLIKQQKEMLENKTKLHV